jgi:hypothetical protein
MIGVVRVSHCGRPGEQGIARGLVPHRDGEVLTAHVRVEATLAARAFRYAACVSEMIGR